MELHLLQTLVMLAYLSMGVISARSNSPNTLDLSEEFYQSKYSDEKEVAKTFLTNFNKRADELMHIDGLKNWAYETDLTDKNLQEKVEADLKVAEYLLEEKDNASSIKIIDLAPDIQRQIMLIRRTGDPTSSVMRREIRETIGKLTNIFGTAKISKASKNYSLSDLDEIMSNSRDRKTLDWAWKGWRNAVGKMKSLYPNLIDLLNIGAREHGWIDYGDYSRSDYEMGDDFELSLDKIWKKIEPLYKELHAYVRYRLRSVYKIKESGKIPASLLGDMFAQNWENIFPLVKPTKTSRTFDVTKTLKKQKYTVDKMFHLAEQFFASLGLEKMPGSFWKKSVFTKPPDKEMVCHASAWDVSNKDVRIKMCTKINQRDLTTIHHEMGHIEYFLAYKNQPNTFRAGANPGFHEAIGDTISLSVETPSYLKEIGLLDTTELPEEDTISFLLNQALRRVAPIPYNLLVDKWRWRVYEGNITENRYNREWWKLRVKYQGVEPPVRRPADAFDPASKYHIGANVQYVAYFVSYVLQFQLHHAFCKEAKFKGPLHLCSIYKSKEAGSKLKKMLEAGRSKPWPKILKEATGERELKADAILAYFQPLYDWLQNYRSEKKYPIGWDTSFSKPVLQKKPKKYEAGQERSGILKTNSGDVSLQINIPSTTWNELMKKGNMSDQLSEVTTTNNQSHPNTASANHMNVKTPSLMDLAKLLNSAKSIQTSNPANNTATAPNLNGNALNHASLLNTLGNAVSNNAGSGASAQPVQESVKEGATKTGTNPTFQILPFESLLQSGLQNTTQSNNMTSNSLTNHQPGTQDQQATSLNPSKDGHQDSINHQHGVQTAPLNLSDGVHPESPNHQHDQQTTPVNPSKDVHPESTNHQHGMNDQQTASLNPSKDGSNDAVGDVHQESKETPSVPHNHGMPSPTDDHQHQQQNEPSHVPSAATERPHANFPSVSVSQMTPKENPKTAGVSKEQSNPLSAAVQQSPKQSPATGNQIALLPVSLPGNVLSALQTAMNGTNSLDLKTLSNLAANSTMNSVESNQQNNVVQSPNNVTAQTSHATGNNTSDEATLITHPHTATENAETTLEEANTTVAESSANQNTSRIVSEDSISHDPQADSQLVDSQPLTNAMNGSVVNTVQQNGFRTTQNVMPCKRDNEKCLFGKVVTEGDSLPIKGEGSKGTVSVSPSLLIQKILEHHVAEKSTPEAVENVPMKENTTKETSDKVKGIDMDQLMTALTGGSNSTKENIENEKEALSDSLNTKKNNESFPMNCSGLQKRGISLTFNCKENPDNTLENTKEHKKGNSLSISPADLIKKLLESKSLKNEVNRKTIPSANVIKTSNGFQLNFDLNPKDKIPSQEGEIVSKPHNPIGRFQHVNVYDTPKGMVVKPKSSVQLLKPLFVPVQSKDKIELGGKDSKNMQ